MDTSDTFSLDHSLPSIKYGRVYYSPVNDTSGCARKKKCITRAHNKQGQAKRSWSWTIPTNRISPRAWIYLLRRNKFSGNICRALLPCASGRGNIRLRNEVSLCIPYLSPWIKLFLSIPIERNEREEVVLTRYISYNTSVSWKILVIIVVM